MLIQSYGLCRISLLFIVCPYPYLDYCLNLCCEGASERKRSGVLAGNSSGAMGMDKSGNLEAEDFLGSVTLGISFLLKLDCQILSPVSVIYNHQISGL